MEIGSLEKCRDFLKDPNIPFENSEYFFKLDKVSNIYCDAILSDALEVKPVLRIKVIYYEGRNYSRV